MRFKTTLVGFLAVIFSVASLSSFAQNEINNKLVKKWKATEVLDISGNSICQLSDNDFLSFLKDDSKFSCNFVNEKIHASGLWSVKDSILELTYNLENIEVDIDSIAYNVVNKQPQLVYFKDGFEIVRDETNHLTAVQESKTFLIAKCTKDSLVLQNDKMRISCISSMEDGTIIDKGSGFSFTSFYRGIIGLFVILALAYLFSSNRKAISWRVVSIGLGFQIIIAIAVLKISVIQNVIEFIGKMFIKVLDFTKVGSEFLFGGLVDPNTYGFLFAFQILPTIIFFSALTSILFYYGIIQKIVYGLAWLLSKALKISGAESLSASGNIFLGQTESPLLIKEYLSKMNKSEIMLVMVGGMATIAGGVLAIYIGLLGGDDPVGRLLFAKHLITASVMAAPGGVVAAKMLVPQTESIESEIKITRESIGTNILDAITNGTSQGVKLAVNVAAMLLVFLAMIAMVNYIFLKIGDWTTLNAVITNFTGGQYNEFSLQFVFGYALAPLAWLMGVCAEDMTLVAQLFGEKIILNELIAYVSLKDMISSMSFTQEKSIIMATYMLCGFANFSSIGIQIGGIGALAPNKRKLLSKLGFKALIGGALASLLSATLVGMILG